MANIQIKLTMKHTVHIIIIIKDVNTNNTTIRQNTAIILLNHNVKSQSYNIIFTKKTAPAWVNKLILKVNNNKI